MNHGAGYQHSMYWKFIGQEAYESEYFCNAMKLATLSVNIYYFFVRRWCLPQCLSHLFSVPTGVMSYAGRNKAVELMFVLLLSGVCFVPGGHH